MSTKTFTWIGIVVGSTIGGTIPLLWGGSTFSFSSIFLGAAGALVGLYLGWKIANY